MIYVTERYEYDWLVSRGQEPLIDTFHFTLDIKLRKEIQRELFGNGRTQESNERFYRWCWAHKPHICEETMRPLHEYSAVYISHILSRGAYAEMATDPRNVNILCLEAHNRWENGNRKRMRIYNKNQMTIELLKQDYSHE